MNPNDNNQTGQTTPNDWQQMSDTNQNPVADPNLSTPMSLPGDKQETNQMAQSYPTVGQNMMPSETPMNGTQYPVDPMQQQTVGPQTTSDGTEIIPRDPNVLNFMIQAVQEKHKEGADPKFVQTEAERLYDEFGEKLVDYFEPMLSKEQIEQFDKLMSEGTSQDQLLAFLMSCIPDLTGQIEKVLIEFKEKYIYGF